MNKPTIELNQDLWQYLPPELLIIILSRLPIRSIIRFKCVCKSWLDLFKSWEFLKFHLCNSKSNPGLAFFEDCSKQCHFMSPIDELEQYELGPKCLFSIALKFRLPAHLKHVYVRSSVNGLLLFSDKIHFICNPLTREYIKLPSSSHEPNYDPRIGFGFGFGFGVSKTSGEYKVVRVCKTKCEVYTLGMGSWRSVAPCSYDHTTTATFVNGNLHWLIHDSNATYTRTLLGISCFDLETELFSIFPPPPPHVYGIFSAICALEGRLAFIDSESGKFIIWLMNEYGDDKSWTRKFSITYQPGALCYEDVIPIKVFRDGDVLIAQLGYSRRLCYFNKTNNTIKLYGMPFGLGCRKPVNYTPSFLSLKTFSAENVSSFEFECDN